MDSAPVVAPSPDDRGGAIRTSDLLENVPCPLCGSERFSVMRAARYPAELTPAALAEIYRSASDRELFDQLVRCDRCSVAYLSPRIRADLIVSAYADAVDPTFFEQNPMRIRTFDRSLRWLERQLALDPRATRVLDVGCAGGAFPAAAKQRGYAATGVEPSRWLASQARDGYGVDVRAGTLAEQRFPESSFDLVTLWDVLEHLTDPSAAITEVRRVLRPGGHLVVSYPDLSGVVARAMGWRWPFFLSVHLTYFDRATIRRFLDERGFDVLAIRPLWQTLEWGYVLQRASLCARPVGPLHRLVRALGLGHLPFTYHLSQFLVLARSRP